MGPEASSPRGHEAHRRPRSRAIARGPTSLATSPATSPPHARTDYTSSVTDLTEGAVARRVPALTDERLRVLSRRQPVTVPPGTSLAECVRAIQRTGTGDSVFVCDASASSRRLTERDIFARIVVPCRSFAAGRGAETTEPRTLDSIRRSATRSSDADRSLPHVPSSMSAPSRRVVASGHHQVSRRVVSRGLLTCRRATSAHAAARRRMTTTKSRPSRPSRSRSSSESRSGSPAIRAMGCAHRHAVHAHRAVSATSAPARLPAETRTGRSLPA